MQLNQHHDLRWLQFEKLSAYSGLQHASFLRHGFSDSLISNLERMNALLQSSSLCHLNQCHGTECIEIQLGMEGEIGSADAMMTQEKGILLVIKHADCQAAILYDPVHHAVANVHCGWRGNVHNIYAHVIDQMHKHYGTHPHDLVVGISPSLGPNKSEFVNYRTEFPPSFWSFQIRPNYFDLWKISEQQLIACGVLPDHIEIAAICTYSNPQDFFSYRYNKTIARQATVVMLR